jgi:peptidoglycan/LPS O-acetylase OafA/YrhL
LLVLTIVMLLITRSPRPLVRLIQDIRQDWTRLSFALYAALTWLMLLISYDSKTWYNQTAYLPLNLFLFSLLFTVGAFLYMWRRRPWPRVLALKATLILYFLVIVLVPTLDGRSVFGSNSTVIARFSYFLFLLMWTSVPLAPGLAQKAWHRLRPI